VGDSFCVEAEVSEIIGRGGHGDVRRGVVRKAGAVFIFRGGHGGTVGRCGRESAKRGWVRGEKD